MREQIKQLLKNSVYRAIGETANGLGAVNGDGRSLRVLMYHKVNDLPNNRMSMPVSRFDEQMAELKELGYTVPRRLGKLGDGPSVRPSPAVALARLLPLAARIDPDGAPGDFWLALSRRPPLRWPPSRCGPTR